MVRINQYELTEAFVLLSKLILEMVVCVAFHIDMLGSEEENLLTQVNSSLVSLFEAVVILDDDNDQASCSISP